jgi:hypothetical protein
MNAFTEKEIMKLMNDEFRQIEDSIDWVVKEIQKGMSVQYLPHEMLAIMNMWARTEWYHLGVAKFEYCLHTIVARETKHLVFDELVKELRDAVDQMVDENDLRWVVNRVSSYLSSGYWQTMDIELLAEAKHWVSVHGEHVTAGDGGHFQWYDSIKEVVCYHLLHIPEPEEPIEEQVAMRSLERLPCDFQHEADWTCAICMEVDALVPTCVRTACMHIFHKSCLEDYNSVFLTQEENCNKTCCLCPMCRAVIN